MTTDYRALCAELTFCWSRTTNPDDFTENVAPIVERMKAALAQPEPVGPTDDELIEAAKAAVDTYPRVSELPYFLDPDSSEYEPMLLALRAAAALPLPSPSDHH